MFRRAHCFVQCRKLLPNRMAGFCSDSIVERICPPIVSVRSVPDEKETSLTLQVDGKLRQLNRNKHDQLQNTLKRILLSIVRQKMPKNQRKKSSGDVIKNDSVPGDPNIDLLCNGSKVPASISNESAWKEGSVLMIGNLQCKVVVNAPTVQKLELPDNIMAGFPVFPVVKFQFGSVRNSKFTWFKMATPPSGIDLKTKEYLEQELSWEKIGDGFTFTPSIDCMRYKIKCVCQPGNDKGFGPFLQSAIGANPVSAGPGSTFADTRALYTQKYLENKNQFRIVTYNVLADVFADNDFSKTHFYPLCPEYAIDFYYRRQLILKELFHYHADIICLQECELKMFESYLQPALEERGFQGFLKLKLGEMPEGEALFIRCSKFKQIEDFSISLRDALYLPCNKDLFQSLSSYPDLLEELQKRTTVAQIHLLQEQAEAGRYLLLINTHLYFRPQAADIRVLQVALIANFVRTLVTDGQGSVSVIFCGDLNSTKGTPALQYLCGSDIKEDNVAWQAVVSQAAGFKASLKSPLSLFNASGDPQFTNFVPGFQETLDYIFASRDDFEVTSFIPLPTYEEVEMYGALPNVVSPSDHLAVVLEMEWKQL